jgi:hypothetical protein
MICKRLRNAATKRRQAPTTISRRKRSACFSATRFCKSDRVNPPFQRQT